MNLSLIAAIGPNGEIGVNNKIPWHIPEDLKRFKSLTENHTVVMGRKTFESIVESIGRPLPKRKNIILTKNTQFSPEGCVVVHSLEETLKEIDDDGEVFIIGGSQIYKDFLPYVSRMYLTKVDGQFSADTYFPEINYDEWRLVENSGSIRSEREGANFSYLTYERVKA